MTRGGIQEYTEAVRGRYLRASKKEKGRILDEFTTVVGCHRKAAIRLLHRRNQGRVNRKCGCPRQYVQYTHLNPWIEREDCPTPTTVLVIARLDRAIQKLAQHASWIIRSSRMMTLLKGLLK
jgi:hypothetical protein